LEVVITINIGIDDIHSKWVRRGLILALLVKYYISVFLFLRNWNEVREHVVLFGDETA
jgi:hypothetical protein